MEVWDTLVVYARSIGIFDESNQLPGLIGTGNGPLHVLELRPGDSLIGGLIAWALGATHTWPVRINWKEIANFPGDAGRAAFQVIRLLYKPYSVFSHEDNV